MAFCNGRRAPAFEGRLLIYPFAPLAVTAFVAKNVLILLPRTVLFPSGIIAVDGLPGREVPRQLPPCKVSLCDIQDGIDHLSHGCPPIGSTRQTRRKELSRNLPLGIHQFSWVTVEWLSHDGIGPVCKVFLPSSDPLPTDGNHTRLDVDPRHHVLHRAVVPN